MCNPINYNLQEYAPEQITNNQQEQHNNKTEFATKAREVRPVATTLSVMIPSSFYIYNDFACISNNKWLRQFIPVRWEISDILGYFQNIWIHVYQILCELLQTECI